MKRRTSHLRTLAALVVVMVCEPHGSAAAQAVAHLRPIDRATVRIISVRGANASVVESSRTGARRIWADPHVRHGSGVAVGPRLIVTAAHVVSGAEHWAVVPPGQTEAIAARPRVIHPSLDVAVLEVDQDLASPVRVSAARPLTLSERLSSSGYPLDVLETSPAAVTGELSRVSRTGLLHLAMTVNPGNSGGPIIDEQGRLVGILSARGRVDAGVEGLAIAVPIEPVVEMLAALPTPPPTCTVADREVARAIPLLLSLADQALDPSQAEATALLTRSLARTEPDAEADALVAALGWNVVLTSLEQGSLLAADPATPIGRLQAQAVRLAQRSLRVGPHVRRAFPVLAAISHGRTNVPQVMDVPAPQPSGATPGQVLGVPSTPPGYRR